MPGMEANRKFKARQYYHLYGIYETIYVIQICSLTSSNIKAPCTWRFPVPLWIVSQYWYFRGSLVSQYSYYRGSESQHSVYVCLLCLFRVQLALTIPGTSAEHIMLSPCPDEEWVARNPDWQIDNENLWNRNRTTSERKVTYVSLDVDPKMEQLLENILIGLILEDEGIPALDMFDAWTEPPNDERGGTTQAKEGETRKHTGNGRTL